MMCRALPALLVLLLGNYVAVAALAFSDAWIWRSVSVMWVANGLTLSQIFLVGVVSSVAEQKRG